MGNSGNGGNAGNGGNGGYATGNARSDACIKAEMTMDVRTERGDPDTGSRFAGGVLFNDACAIKSAVAEYRAECGGNRIV